MSDKLGFTFYPKDWWTSESYFELNPIQRYYYLECLFIMYSNDGYMKTQKTQFENRIRTQVLESDWQIVISKFILDNEMFTHTSVNKRLRKAISNRENGKKGGRPPKEEKPKKPNLETQNNPPLERERESEEEIETKTIITDVEIIDFNDCHNICLFDDNWKESIERVYRVDKDKIQYALLDFNNHCSTIGENKSKSLNQFKKHFTNWVRVKKQYHVKTENKDKL